MTTDDDHAEQRRAWRKALSKAAAVKRSQRFTRKPRPIKTGMIRKPPPPKKEAASMFLAQLAAFLTTCHHAHWASVLPQLSPHRFAVIYDWALRHGFAYQR